MGEVSSLPDLPGLDWGRNHTHTLYFRAWEDGAGRGGEAIPWLGAPLHRWVWGVIGPSYQLGDGRGRDGQGVVLILSSLHGLAQKRLPRKGWTVELGSSAPWEPYYAMVL